MTSRHLPISVRRTPLPDGTDRGADDFSPGRRTYRPFAHFPPHPVARRHFAQVAGSARNAQAARTGEPNQSAQAARTGKSGGSRESEEGSDGAPETEEEVEEVAPGRHHNPDGLAVRGVDA